MGETRPGRSPARFLFSLAPIRWRLRQGRLLARMVQGARCQVPGEWATLLCDVGGVAEEPCLGIVPGKGDR